MADTLDGSHFSIAIVGTSLSQSILAGSLAKSGYEVLHIDSGSIYGSENATLSLDELLAFAAERTDASVCQADHGLGPSRQYSLSLAPALLPSISPFVSTLIRSGVNKYTGFRLLEHVIIFSNGHWRRVPSSKEDIFKDTSLSLIEKRRLMKALLFALGDWEENEAVKGREDTPFLEFLSEQFNLGHELSIAVAFGVALCTSFQDATGPALSRLRKYLRSSGRYGPSSFLIGQYGGLGELAQGFCRTCAVFGGTYILGQSIDLITVPENGSCQLRLHSDPIQEVAADHVVIGTGSATLIDPPQFAWSDIDRRRIARAIIILDRPLEALSGLAWPSQNQNAVDGTPTEGTISQSDTALLVLPPDSEQQRTHAGTVVVMGSGTFSCPEGHYVVYLAQENPHGLSPIEALLPLISALELGDAHQASPDCLLRVVYEDSYTIETPGIGSAVHSMPPCGPASLGEIADVALEQAFQVWKKISGRTDAVVEDMFEVDGNDSM